MIGFAKKKNAGRRLAVYWSVLLRELDAMPKRMIGLHLRGTTQESLSKIAFSLVAVLIACFSISPCALAQGNESAVLKGRVINQDGNPVPKSKIVVVNDDNQQKYSGMSDGKGYFKIPHDACESLSFDVIPPEKSGLCRADFNQVNGESAKHFIVQLHQGFQVSGCITFCGVGLKGLNVDVYGYEDNAQAKGVVHGGGSTKTKGKGEFAMLLTPGKKTIKITNEIYSNVPSIFYKDCLITGDCRLADIVIPQQEPNKAIEGNKE